MLMSAAVLKFPILRGWTSAEPPRAVRAYAQSMVRDGYVVAVGARVQDVHPVVGAHERDDWRDKTLLWAKGEGEPRRRRQLTNSAAAQEHNGEGSFDWQIRMTSSLADAGAGPFKTTWS